MESKVSPEVTKQLIENQLQLWRNTLEDWRISYKVGEALEDDAQKQHAAEGSKKCIKAIETLEKMLEELG